VAERAQIFLSYARPDRKKAEVLAKVLEQQGRSVWWDFNLLSSQDVRAVILEHLNTSRCVIVLWSKNSVKSPWVMDEAERGQRRAILVPAVIDEVDIPIGFGGIHAENLAGWDGTLPHSGVERLQEAVSRILGPFRIPDVPNTQTVTDTPQEPLDQRPAHLETAITNGESPKSQQKWWAELIDASNVGKGFEVRLRIHLSQEVHVIEYKYE